MKIKIYLSKQGYDVKPDKNAGIIKSLNSYRLVDIDIETLYKKLANGHFVHHECGASPSTTGSKSYTFKKQLLKQTQLMCIDFDYKFKVTKPNGDVINKHYEQNEMPEWSAELLSNLKFNENGYDIDISPTFWMESFSAHKETERKKVGNSVHLFYVFEDSITNAYVFERVGVVIILMIYKALKAKGYDIPLEKDKSPIDPVSIDMFQGLWGSSHKQHAYNGNTYFWDELEALYKPEYKDFLFQVKTDENNEATDDEIRRTINAYKTVNTIDDIDINKSQYIKYKKYFGHEEGFHIISALKCEYSKIEEEVNNRQSLCYQVCKKLLLGHCNDFFDNDETHFYHEYKRCKMYYKKGTHDAAYMSHVIKLVGDTGAIPLIEYKQEENTNIGNIIKLNKNEYLSDKMTDIMKLLSNDSINFLIAAPGLGKTVFSQSLEGNTLIIELFNSIIRSEEKFDSNIYEKYMENNYISDDKISSDSVCSANKFITWYKTRNKYMHNYICDDLPFKNIILDESHLLCLSNYRYDIMGETVECLKKLKNEHPETMVIIMTGTPFGETCVFDNLNIIRIEADKRYDKKFHMIQTTSIDGYMRQLVKETLSKNERVFIPVDSENWFDTFVESLIEEGIITKDKTYYFNQPKSDEETEQYILNTKLIGDIKILGTSSYMSVGIDLEDWKTEFVTIIPSGASSSGNFSGIEVEQFANRHRKQNLEVYYVISNNEANNKKPVFTTSCRALLNIKNDIIRSMYRTVPIIIRIPAYLIPDEGEYLTLHEDMFNVFVYYNDMKSVISHPMNVYDYMKNIGWDSSWEYVENTHRGIDTKEHRAREKQTGVSEFMNVINEWATDNYPIIKIKDSIYEDLEITKHNSKTSLFDIDYYEVGFKTYYAKNTLFGMFLNIREYLTGLGTYRLISDSYNNDKINMAMIDRTMRAIKIVNNYKRAGIWEDIANKYSEFYNRYSDINTGVTSDNKNEFKDALNEISQTIWDSLCDKINDSTLKLALDTNYNNVTDRLIDNFMEGIKLVHVMYLDKTTIQTKINGKNTRITTYKWNNKKLERYEVRKDKQSK